MATPQSPPALELPSSTDRPATTQLRSKRPFGVRLWLALMFAAIGILCGTSVYLFVSESSDEAASERSREIAQSNTFNLALDLGKTDKPGRRRAIAQKARTEAFTPWVFNDKGGLISDRSVELAGVSVDDIPAYRQLVSQALGGDEVSIALPGERTAVALPIFRDGFADGVVLSLATRPIEVQSALDALQRERLTALAIAAVVAAIIGFLVASLITTRVKRLASAASDIAEGRLDAPIDSGGRDEIGDLGRAFDSMRISLAQTFAALSSERDRLNAIFTSLDQAVIVVGSDGDVRYANPAAAELIDEDGAPMPALRPWIRRATHRGAADSDQVQLGEKSYAIGIRHLPAENGTLLVVRDRTDELRRDQAEREFVSNAAHELRNPIAGMSGAIEVLRSGAKEDPEARDRFLDRLAIDVDRVSRLTRSLLTLARMESVGQGEGEVVSIGLAIDEAMTAVEPLAEVELAVDVEPDLAGQADPVLLRQVLIGLLTNAFKHTPVPGVVTLRAKRAGEDEIVIEVEDTGTGIAEDERDRVFERFYRGSGSLEREGFGLGLAIAKRMVDVMGGEIGVTSEEGKGSTFTIKLAAAAPSPTPVA